jgi:hypothetical protein
MTCAIRSLGRHDNQAFIQISHVAGFREHRKKDRLDYCSKEPRRRLLWLRRQRRRENGKKYRWGAKTLKRAAYMPKRHAHDGSHAKNQRRYALVETTFDRQYRAGAVRATRSV